MSFIKNTVEVPTTTLNLDVVVMRTECHTHGADYFRACWSYPGTLDQETEQPLRWHEAICNDRARRAGMVGEIRPESLDRSLGRRPRVNA